MTRPPSRDALARQQMREHDASVRATGRQGKCWRCDKAIWHDNDATHSSYRWVDTDGWTWCGATNPGPSPDPHQPKDDT